ncbi:MAG: OmpA family protein [Desulfobacteraceae bacterium]|nr:OmpA family protein [Desulfobacteraceae bacterium]
MAGIKTHLAMAGTDLSDYDIRMTRDRIKLIIGENISFPVGKAELLDHIKGPLAKIGEALSGEQGFRIVVAGHTDTTPINTPRFPSNWELSLARALGVAKFLMARNVNPARISVEGFGPYQPVASNTDPDSRRANRRVEISLIQDDSI